ncbi:MAG: transcription-repair coupling factor (superfamily II helicase), partial [Alcanivorax sp.]
MKLLPDSSLFPTGREHYKDWAGLDSGSMAAVLAELARSQDHLFVVLAPNSSRAQHLADSLEFYLTGSGDQGNDTPVMLFPDWETLPYDLFSPHQDIISDRIRVLHQLPSSHKGILVVPVNTLMQRLAPPLHITGNSFLLKVGDTFDMEATRSRLVSCGYRQRDNVYEHGEFAVRGAIMDIFPMGADQPFRIELFDDEIESLRLFDAES